MIPAFIAGVSSKEANERAMEILAFMGPVSYTHLDVYKRQELTVLPVYLKDENIPKLSGVHLSESGINGFPIKELSHGAAVQALSLIHI